MPEQLKTFIFHFEKSKPVKVSVPVEDQDALEVVLSAAFNARLEDRLNDGPDFCAEVSGPNTLKHFLSLDEMFLERYQAYFSSRAEEMTLPFEDELYFSNDSDMEYDRFETMKPDNNELESVQTSLPPKY